MTQIIHRKSSKILVPDGFYKNSPLLWNNVHSLSEMWNALLLRWWAEVEVRFINQYWKPAYYLWDKKTNIVLANYIQTQYPTAQISFESSANMIEFDTGLCGTYAELIEQLRYIQSIKEDILHRFELLEWKARVEESELSEPFVNPIDDEVIELIKHHGYDEAEMIITKRNDQKKRDTWVRLSPMKWIQYVLPLQDELWPKILAYTKTTSQQLTLSSEDPKITLWLHAQLLNTIYEYRHKHKHFKHRTDKRWYQRKKVVNYRAEHNLWVKSGYEPKFPGSDYRKYFKKNYFENHIKDNYRIGDIEKFVMSHGPQSKKFSLDEWWNPIPRTEFRLQDSMENAVDALHNLEYIFELMLSSPHKNNPLYNYTYCDI
jgi:hypothetical protein